MRKGSTLLINNLFSPKVIPLQALVLGKLRKGIKFAQKRCIDGLFNHLRPRQGGRSYPISCKNVYMKQSMGGNHVCYVHTLDTTLVIKITRPEVRGSISLSKMPLPLPLSAIKISRKNFDFPQLYLNTKWPRHLPRVGLKWKIFERTLMSAYYQQKNIWYLIIIGIFAK